MAATPTPNYLIYFVRHDIRLSDNPILHKLASTKDHGLTHLLVVYVFTAEQIEVSGFIQDGSPSPYPPAKSKLRKLWRTGPYRAKFITQCVWNLKKNLESVGSGLLIRVGSVGDVASDLIEGLCRGQDKVGGIWITQEEGVEERRDQKALFELCTKKGVALTLFDDEKYFIDELVQPVAIFVCLALTG